MQIKSTLKKINTELTEKMEEINHIKETYKKELQAKFAPLFDELFNSYPKLAGFSWTQYTPYFNDGDTCEFRVNDVVIYTDSYEGEVGDLNYPEDEEGTLNLYDWDKPVERKWGLQADGKYGYADTETPNAGYAAIHDVLDDEGYEVVKSIVDLIGNSDNEEFMQSLFGDHVKVVVNRRGIETEEFDHD